MKWLTTTLQSIRDLTIAVLMAVGVIAIIRWMTKGKWPDIKPGGDVVAPPADAKDLPSQKDLDKYLQKLVLALVMMSSILVSSISASAATSAGADFTNACVLGMYEYRQLLDGKSTDKVTNVLHIEDGLYRLYFDMGVNVYGQDRQRHLLRIIPIKLDSKPSSCTSWGWIIAGVIAGGILGYAIAK